MMRFPALISAALFIAGVLLTAQPGITIEAPAPLTRTAQPGLPGPKAELSELGWLQGTWEGQGIDGAPSLEVWAAPIGGAMPGLFVQADGKGGTMFSEYMQIVPNGESLVLRLKHFNADLTGWEEKDKTVNFALVARDNGALYFNGLTYKREDADQLIVAVRMRNADGTTSELIFRFRKKAP